MEAEIRCGLDDARSRLLELGLHHEQQHQELLLMDIKHVLGTNPTLPAYADLVRGRASAAPRPGWFEHDGGMVEIGHQGSGFAFDNESPRHEVHLGPFALADRLVTCGEWLEFIDDGGYRRPELWLSDGWATVNAQHWDSPLYWRCTDTGWRVFSLGGESDVVATEPVCHVSYYEADAFARWSGARLPTEFEWETVAATSDTAGRFLDLERLHPSPQPSPSVLGDVWVWTSSAYLPYPRFKVAEGAVGEYNGKFMVNQHVLRGGSCTTPPGHTRCDLPQLLPPVGPLGFQWRAAGPRSGGDVSSKVTVEVL